MRRNAFIFIFAIAASLGTISAASGTCGDNLTWNLTNGLLTISGNGTMTDWSSASAVPWYSYRKNVKSVTIGDSVTSIGEYAFFGCSYMTTVTIPNKVTIIGFRAFYDCCGITSVIIGNSVITIGISAFEGCVGLTSVEVLGETPANLKANAFKDCVQLSNIYVPCGTIDAYKNSWRYPSKIKYHSLEYTITGYINDTTQGTVIVPTTICDNPITAIPNYGYHFVQWSDGNTDNPRIIELTQDTSFTAEFALDRSGRCGNDSSLTWQYNPTTKTFTISGAGAFIENIECGVEARPELEKVIIGEGVTAISTEAFADCSNLTTIEWNAINGGDYTVCPFPTTVTYVTFGANVEHIPAHLCDGTNATNALVFPNSLKSIGKYAFKGWTNLKNINIPNGVETIGEHAFDSCIYVTSIYLGHKITEIGNYTFKGCIRVNDITCMNTTTPVVYSATLSSISYRAYLYVPIGSKRTYQIDPYWGYFDIREIASEETTLTNNVVTVETNEDNAIFTWPTNNNAASYTLQITKDGEVFCTLVFNNAGQLITIAFAPGKYGNSHRQVATTFITGMSFTITGLNKACKYSYRLSVSDGQNNELVAYSGEFATSGYEGEITPGGNPENLIYSIRFVNWNNVELVTLQVQKGEMPIYSGAIPVRPDDEQYTYTFDGWTPTIVPVVADATYTATYTAKKKAEGVEDVLEDFTKMPSKSIENGNIYILMPNGQKYSIVGELIK